MRALLKTLGVVAAIAATTFLSGFAALAGARGAGLEEGGWNWQFLPPLVYGWVGSFIVSLVCLAIMASLASKYSRLLAVTFLTPLLLAFVVSAAAYSMTRPASPKPILAKIKAHPESLRALIDKARTKPLSQAERYALWQMVWVEHAIPVEDISFLLDYFAQDGSALGGIMTYQAITAEQLRYLYERHKHAREYSRVLDELASHPLTPSDVLQALTEESSKSLVAKVRERISKSQ